MSNEHLDMNDNPMDAPFLCNHCEKEFIADRIYGSDTAPDMTFCSLECVNKWQESQIAALKSAPGMEEVDALKEAVEYRKTHAWRHKEKDTDHA